MSFIVVKHLPDWFPGADFKHQAREWRKSVAALVNVPFNDVKHASVKF